MASLHFIDTSDVCANQFSLTMILIVFFVSLRIPNGMVDESVNFLYLKNKKNNINTL